VESAASNLFSQGWDPLSAVTEYFLRRENRKNLSVVGFFVDVLDMANCARAREPHGALTMLPFLKSKRCRVKSFLSDRTKNRNGALGHAL
jgi:hypothetical protein